MTDLIWKMFDRISSTEFIIVSGSLILCGFAPDQRDLVLGGLLGFLTKAYIGDKNED